MSFIPKILSTNNSQQKKQIYFQQLAQQKWVISKQIIGNVKITITDQSGIELKERKNNIGDYDVVYNGNLIEIHFNIPVAGKCELLLYENTISNIINKSLDSFKSSDLFLLLPHNKDIIPIQYTTLSSTIYTGNIYKIITGYRILIHNINFNIYKISTGELQLAQNDIINIIINNNNNNNNNNNYILLNTYMEILNGQLTINKFLPIIVEKTDFYIENNKIELLYFLQ